MSLDDIENMFISPTKSYKSGKYIIIRDPFSTDNGLLTPTMKIRRHKIKEMYGESLDDLYGSKAL